MAHVKWFHCTSREQQISKYVSPAFFLLESRSFLGGGSGAWWLVREIKEWYWLFRIGGLVDWMVSCCVMAKRKTTKSLASAPRSPPLCLHQMTPWKTECPRDWEQREHIYMLSPWKQFVLIRQSISLWDSHQDVKIRSFFKQLSFIIEIYSYYHKSSP